MVEVQKKMAAWVADGTIFTPIAATYPLSRVEGGDLSRSKDCRARFCLEAADPAISCDSPADGHWQNAWQSFLFSPPGWLKRG